MNGPITKAQWILAMSVPIDLAEAGKRRDWLADEILSALSTARQETREQTIRECATMARTMEAQHAASVLHDYHKGAYEAYRAIAQELEKLGGLSHCAPPSPPPPKRETEEKMQ